MLVPLITRISDVATNPGDTFIAWGLQYLISQIIKDPEFLLIDKFGPTHFNLYIDLVKKAGFIIYAGMPQYNNYDDWMFFYDWDVFIKHIMPMRIKFHTIAGGSGFPDPSQTPQEFSDYLLASNKTRNILNTKKKLTGLATVRDQHAFQLLKDLGQDVHLLPCTAAWSPQWVNTQITASNTVALVPPSPKHINPALVRRKDGREASELFANYLADIGKQLRVHGLESRVVCHCLAEYEFYKDNFDVFYSNDLHSLMRFYGTAHGVISARLHGAIPVAGMNKPAVLIGIDTRVSAAEPLGIPTINVGPDIVKTAPALYMDQVDKTNYRSVLDDSREQYADLLKGILSCG